MKTINLEYTNIPVLLPSIDYFIDKIKNNKPFHFLRANHGILDLIHLGYSNLSEFENSYLSNDFESIAEKMVSSSEVDVNRPLETYHKNTEKSLLKEKIIIFLKVLKEYKNIFYKIEIGVSLGVGLHTHWGVWNQTHPYQIGRTNVWKIIDRNKINEFYYAGVLKHYTIKQEIHELFNKLNENNFCVIFLGREYLNLYENIFNIKNFHHIVIPNSGAINFVDEYIDKIKYIASNYDNTIVIHSTGHIISFYIAHELNNSNIFGLDIGRSFDILIKNNNNSDIPVCWTRLDEHQLNNYVDNIRR